MYLFNGTYYIEFGFVRVQIKWFRIREGPLYLFIMVKSIVHYQPFHLTSSISYLNSYILIISAYTLILSASAVALSRLGWHAQLHPPIQISG